ncbi:methyltransferase domain-containing protein [Fragilaria crotonensis]|nr:methyltransferase domain-containing protein [Fragilaria crotonensis]
MVLSPLSMSRGQQMLASSTPDEVLRNPMSIPRGQAKALPSIRQAGKEDVVKRDIYGGAGDKKHLGGFTDIDTAGISPRAWKWMVQRLNIQSVLDVGCGRGISTTWFLFHGLSALCVEGSHDAREKTMLPDPDNQMVEHDFARGPWWPGRTFDAVWCVEFLEHVGRNFHQNYLPAFRKAGIIFVTHSINGGWHHVEVHRATWWRIKMESYGFQYRNDLTMEIRTLVWNETHARDKG